MDQWVARCLTPNYWLSNGRRRPTSSIWSHAPTSRRTPRSLKLSFWRRRFFFSFFPFRLKFGYWMTALALCANKHMDEEREREWIASGASQEYISRLFEGTRQARNYFAQMRRNRRLFSLSNSIVSLDASLLPFRLLFRVCDDSFFFSSSRRRRLGRVARIHLFWLTPSGVSL